MGAHPAAPESPISKSADYPKLLSPTGFNAGRFVPQTGDALRVLIEEETPSQVDGFRLGGSGTPARGAVRFRARSGGLAGARPPATIRQPSGLRNWLQGNHFQQEFLKRRRGRRAGSRNQREDSNRSWTQINAATVFSVQGKSLDF